MNNNAKIVKRKIEDTYDIPFYVSEGKKYEEPWFDIRPEGSNKEFFEIHVEIKNNLRIIVEITPEEYAAFSIQDMSHASEEKKRIFSGYAEMINRKRAKIDFFVNDTKVDPLDYRNWPEQWKNYRCRISKSPVVLEDEYFDLASTVANWAGMAAGMFLSLLNVVSIEENSDSELMSEGGQRKILVNRYERNPFNRELCLANNGYSCKICGFDFENFYGHIGKQYIHVHHIVPISEIKNEYMIDPVHDLIPVCPNCHAMLHRVNPPLKPEELRAMLKEDE